MNTTADKAPAATLALLGSALMVSACGLVYELVTGALASYLIGDSVTQFSTVIGCYLFAMGLGAWLSNGIHRDLPAAFVRVELLVGLVGGLSTLLLYWVFAHDYGFRAALYGVVLIIGTLVGLEIPLLMRLLRQSYGFETLIARVLSFDYFGALLAALAFPLLCVPYLGLMKTSLFFGLLNIAVAAGTLQVLDLPRRQRLRLVVASAAIAALLVVAWLQTSTLTRHLENQIYQERVLLSEQSRYQRIVLTERRGQTSLWLNGHLQFNSGDEYRYHEALVYPAVRAAAQLRHALVLGGGDGLAVRELLRTPGLESVTLVDLDERITTLARDHSVLADLNQNAYRDPRVQVVNADAWQWLSANTRRFDVIVMDFPDPSNYSIGKLYSAPFFRLTDAALSPGGALVVQSTSPLFAREAYWCIVATLEQAGFVATPYHAYVPSFGEWGYVLATHAAPVFHRPLPEGLKFLDEQSFAALFQFPVDLARLPVEPNRLDTQKLVEYYGRAWRSSLVPG